MATQGGDGSATPGISSVLDSSWTRERSLPQLESEPGVLKSEQLDGKGREGIEIARARDNADSDMGMPTVLVDGDADSRTMAGKVEL